MDRLVRLMSVVLGFCGWVITAQADESGSRMIDSPINGYEATNVELVINSSSEVVQVVTEGCELCASPRFLPSQGFYVRVGRNEVNANNFRRYSGMPGTVMVDSRNGFATSVMFYVHNEENGK